MTGQIKELGNISLGRIKVRKDESELGGMDHNLEK